MLTEFVSGKRRARTRDYAMAILVMVIGVIPVSCHCHPFSLQAIQGLDLNGWSVNVDSYNSADPAKSTNGLYDPTKAGDSGDVAFPGGITNRLPVGNIRIFGHLYSASNAPAILGALGGIGTHAWLATNSGIEPGFKETATEFTFPNVSQPYNEGKVPVGGDIVGSSGVTNHYDHILSDGDYLTSGLSGRTIVIGNARLLVSDGLLMGGADTIEIAPTASLVLYCGGTFCSIIGMNILNQRLSARSFVVFCSARVTNVNLDGKGSFAGVLVAPSALVSLNGAGTATTDVIGFLIAGTLELNGNFNFHFDESLNASAILSDFSSQPGVGFQFKVSGIPAFHYEVQTSADLMTWSSIVTNNSPFTFVDPAGTNAQQRFYRAIYSP